MTPRHYLLPNEKSPAAVLERARKKHEKVVTRERKRRAKEFRKISFSTSEKVLLIVGIACSALILANAIRLIISTF